MRIHAKIEIYGDIGEGGNIIVGDMAECNLVNQSDRKIAGIQEI